MIKRTILSLAAVLMVAGLVRISVAGEKAAAKIGNEAPAFSLQDQNGKTVSLSDFKDKVVVLEWFNEQCPYCAKHYSTGNMEKLATKYAEKGVVWLAINSTNGKSNADNKAISDKWKISFPILNDASGEVGHAYNAKTTPHMYVINKGTLVYMGAIDNKPTANPKDIEGAKNYVSQALDEVLAGSNVSEPETKAYGCSVKYAN